MTVLYKKKMLFFCSEIKSKSPLYFTHYILKDEKHRYEKVFHQVKGTATGRSFKNSVQGVIICVAANHMICDVM
jgi:hypothetical protein